MYEVDAVAEATPPTFAADTVIVTVYTAAADRNPPVRVQY